MSNLEDPIGSLIGSKYRLRELLAEGGMGRVYGARHEGTGRVVAVKVLRPELAVRWDIVRRSAREARLAVAARHPNVVEVLDAGQDASGASYLVLERLYGHTLEEHLSKPLGPLAAAQALVPIMNALCALHDSNIVHRDIKPSNLFLSLGPNGLITPKLLDFGVAKALDAAGSTRTGSTLGTPAYMAPEQALGCAPASPAADVWSMAVVWVRALTGQLPFAEGALLNHLRAGRAPIDPTPAFPALSAVLGGALALDPGERFAHMGEFRSALLAALHRLGPDECWPGPLTISLTPGETALAAWLAASAPNPLAARRVKAAREMTQTLRQTASALIHSRLFSSFRGALPLIIAALSFAVIPWLRSMGSSAVAPSSVASALSDEPSIGARILASNSAARDPTGDGSAGDAGAARASARDVLASTNASPSRAPSPPPRARPPRRARRSPAAPSSTVAASHDTPRTPPLGTNRAPIIELP
jgi:eukaryotic-like serine/threonine-protein kinase